MNSTLRQVAPGSTKLSVPAEEIVGALAVLGEDDPSAERVEQLQLQLGADGLPPDSPSETIVKAVAAAQELASARQTLSHYADGDRVSDLYDGDNDFADALRTVAGPGFEYPDFSWMTVGQARRHAERSRSETVRVDAPNLDPRLRVVLLNNKGEPVWQMRTEDPKEALSAFVRLTKRQFGDEHGVGSHVALVDKNSQLDAAKVYEGRKTYIMKFGNDHARDAFYEAEARAAKVPPEIGSEYRGNEPNFEGIVKVKAVYGDRVFYEGDADGSATIAEFHKAYAPVDGDVRLPELSENGTLSATDAAAYLGLEPGSQFEIVSPASPGAPRVILITNDEVPPYFEVENDVENGGAWHVMPVADLGGVATLQEKLESSRKRSEAGNLPETQRQIDPVGAQQFYAELMDSVDTLSSIADEHGSRTLADLMYLQNAIANGGFVDHFPSESSIGEVVKQLPSADRWMKYLSVRELGSKYESPSP
ncbi:hypothetical protein [Burkholderia pseudomallei]|uniref:hypothetical protein n=1 Tax=Burkholderia pseudomallei TaxID=28450 RepID=UPI0012F4CFCB|nr:hypothetical protein [Burkholderia pseudomallei]